MSRRPGGFKRLFRRFDRWVFSLYHDFVCGSDFRIKQLDVRCGNCGRRFD